MLMQDFEFSPLTSDAKSKLIAMGKFLQELGQVPLEEFEEIVYLLWCKQISSLIGRCEYRLQKYSSGPKYWVDDMTKLLENLRHRMRGYCPPQDVLAIIDGERARQLTQRLVLRWGRLLEHWSSIIEATRDLHQEGIKLQRKV